MEYSQYHILDLLECSICRNGYAHYDKRIPKVLPMCGHTFCSRCINRKTKYYGISTTFTCPDCNTVNVIGSTGALGLQTNFGLRKLYEEISKKRKFGAFGEYCCHSDLLSKSITCEHCSHKFCEYCFVSHLDHVRIEAAWEAIDLEQRREKSVEWFSENVGALKKSILDQVSSTSADIVKASVDFERLVVEQIHLSRERMLAKVKQLGEERLSKIERLESVSNQSPLTEIQPKIQEMQELSPFQLSTVHVNDLYEKLSEFNRLVLEMEQLAEDNSTDYGQIKFETKSFAPFGSMEDQIGSIVSESHKSYDDKKLIFNERFYDFVYNADFATVKARFEKLPPHYVKYLLDHEICEEIWYRIAEQGDLDLLRYLVSDCREDIKQFPLNYAVEIGRFDLVKFCCTLDPVMKSRPADDDSTRLDSLIHKASTDGDFGTVRFCVEEIWFNADALGDDRRTALHYAAEKGHLEIVQMLVKRGNANVFYKDAFCLAAIHYAARENHDDIVKYLLHLEPKLVNLKGHGGNTPLHIAARWNNKRVVNSLVKANADVNAKNNIGSTALIEAAGEGKLEIVKILLLSGANPAVVTIKPRVGMNDGDTETAVHRAARFGHLNVVSHLCTVRPDLALLMTTKGRTAHDVASIFRQHAVRRYFDSFRYCKF